MTKGMREKIVGVLFGAVLGLVVSTGITLVARVFGADPDDTSLISMGIAAGFFVLLVIAARS